MLCLGAGAGLLSCYSVFRLVYALPPRSTLPHIVLILGLVRTNRTLFQFQGRSSGVGKVLALYTLFVAVRVLSSPPSLAPRGAVVRLCLAPALLLPRIRVVEYYRRASSSFL